MYKVIAALSVVIACLVSYIGFDVWRKADKQCDIRIEKINDESNQQVELAQKAADSVAPDSNLDALCMHDKYCRDK